MAAAAAKETTVIVEERPQTLQDRVVERTSLATRGTAADEVNVQFRRWTAHGNTAYQKGQYAGFPIPVAEALAARGAVIIDPGYRRGTIADRMVQK